MRRTQRQPGERICAIQPGVFAAASLGLITLRAPSGARDMTRLPNRFSSIPFNSLLSDPTP